MAWQLSDETIDPQAAPAGGFALSDEIHPEANVDIGAEARKRTLAEMSTPEQMLAAAGGGFANIGAEAKQATGSWVDLLKTNPMLALQMVANPSMAAAAFGSPEAHGENRQAADAAMAEKQKVDAPLKDAAPVSYGIGASAPLLLAPEAAPLRALGLTGRLAGALDLAGNGALQGAASAGLASDDPLAGAAGGALGAPLVGGATNLLTKGLGAVPERVAALQAAAQEAGVPLTIGGMGSLPWKMFENSFLKHTPGSGMRGVLEKQAQGMTDRGEAIGADMAAAAPPGDFETTLAQSTRDELARREFANDKLYAQIPKGAETRTENTTPALANLLEEFPDTFNKTGAATSVKDLIGSLTARPEPTNTDLAAIKFFGEDNIKNNPHIAQQIEAANPGFLDRMSGKAQPEIQTLSVGDLHSLGKKLGNAQRALAAKVNSGDADAQQLSMIGQVRDAIRADLNASDHPGAAAAIKNATDDFKTNIAPYRNDPLLAALVDPTNNGQGVLGKLARKGNKDTASAVMDFTGPEGRSALQAGLYDQLTGTGINDALAAGYSPTRLLNALRIGDKPSENRAANAIFSDAQKGDINQFRDLLQSTRTAAGYNAETPGGAKLIPYFLAKAGGAAAALGASAKGAAAGSAAGPLGAIIGALAPFGIARGAKSFTASPAMQRYWFSQGLRNQMLENAGGQAGGALFDQLSN